MTNDRAAKEPLRWTGIIFAFAANLLLVTVADAVARAMGVETQTLATVFAPLLAGAATALYTGQRGALHALVGAAIALPVLALIIFPTAWPLAIFATLFCVLGAALTELGLRRPRQ